jgi:hypothetical protein
MSVRWLAISFRFNYEQAFAVALQREGLKIMLSPYSEQGGFT